MILFWILFNPLSIYCHLDLWNSWISFFWASKLSLMSSVPVNSLMCICMHLDTLEFLLVLWHGSFFYSYMHCTLTGNSRVTENSCKVSEENVWSSCQASSPRWGDCLFNVSFCSTSILQRELVQLVILAGSWATNAPKINIICLSKNWT